MEEIVKGVGAFCMKYRMKLLESHIKDLFTVMIWSNQLHLTASARYVRYIYFDAVLMKLKSCTSSLANRISMTTIGRIQEFNILTAPCFKDRTFIK